MVPPRVLCQLRGRLLLVRRTQVPRHLLPPPAAAASWAPGKRLRTRVLSARAELDGAAQASTPAALDGAAQASTPTELDGSPAPSASADSERPPGSSAGLVQAALSVGAGAAASKALGLVREAALAAAFGVGPVMTAYTYASLVPSFFLTLLGGVNGPFHSAIVANLSHNGSRPQEDAAMVVAVSAVSLGVCVLLAGALYCAAPRVLLAQAPGILSSSGGPELALGVVQMRLMLPCLALAPLLGISFGVLSARGQFLLPSLSPALSSSAVLAAVLLYSLTAPRAPQDQRLLLGSVLLASATTVGAALQLLLMLLSRNKGTRRPLAAGPEVRPGDQGGSGEGPGDQGGESRDSPEDVKGARGEGQRRLAWQTVHSQDHKVEGQHLEGHSLGDLKLKDRRLEDLRLQGQELWTRAQRLHRTGRVALFEIMPKLVQVLQVLVPASVSSGMLQIATFTDLYFASFHPGAAAALGYANLLAMAPIGVLSTAFLVPALPLFARLAQPEDWPELRARVRDAVLMAAALTLPMAALAGPLSRPAVRCVFQRYCFDDSATHLVSALLTAYLVGAPSYLVRDVLVRAFYGLVDGSTPFLVSLLAISANAVLDPLFFSALGLGAPGLVWATVAVNTLSAAALLLCLQRRIGGLWHLEWREPILALMAATACSSGVSVLAWRSFEAACGGARVPWLVEFLALTLTGALGLFTFYGVCIVSPWSDARQVAKSVFGSLKRKFSKLDVWPSAGWKT